MNEDKNKETILEEPSDREGLEMDEVVYRLEPEENLESANSGGVDAQCSSYAKSTESKDISLKKFIFWGLVMLVINGAFFFVYFFQEKTPTEVNTEQNELNEPVAVIESVEVIKEDPEEWFHDRYESNYNEALEILNSFTKAQSAAERSDFVRNPEFYLKNSSQVKMSMSPRLSMQDTQSWNIDHVENKAYLRLLCNDEIGMAFSAYFTREGDSMKLDVAASSAWSEASIENQYEELNDGGTAVVRCLISRQEESYNDPYNDEEHAAYLLKSADEINNIWGYVKRGSDLDNKLKAVLDHGSFVVALKKNVRVTIKVARENKETQVSQVDILELLHEEWVSP
ncbi:hypothetical protein OAI07_00555 [Akkermansiaceae bacterium]|nr:hypothetical protein [Akkermansiaceae bacterium]